MDLVKLENSIQMPPVIEINNKKWEDYFLPLKNQISEMITSLKGMQIL